MLYLKEKPFKKVVFMDSEGSEIQIEEGMNVSITMADSGEIVEGRVIKLAGKELILRVDGDGFDRLISYGLLEDIEVM